MTSGLSGITILDLTQAVSGPFATRLMSQLGARIIKVERPGTGDPIRFWDNIVRGMCSGHAWVNPGKESLALDLIVQGEAGLILTNGSPEAPAPASGRSRCRIVGGAHSGRSQRRAADGRGRAARGSSGRSGGAS